MKTKLRNLFELFFVFFKIGAVTFGGGLAMLSILQKELVDKRNWTTKENLLDYFAIGQSTPGIIAVNVATFLGYNRAGVLGACFATLGVVTPSIIIISVIATFLTGFSENLYVKKALKGINIAVAALLVKIVYNFRQKLTQSIFTFILGLVAFSLVAFFKVNTVFVVLGAVLVGILYHFVVFKKLAEKSELTKNEAQK